MGNKKVKPYKGAGVSLLAGAVTGAGASVLSDTNPESVSKVTDRITTDADGYLGHVYNVVNTTPAIPALNEMAAHAGQVGLALGTAAMLGHIGYNMWRNHKLGPQFK